jgi:hypothetical protein
LASGPQPRTGLNPCLAYVEPSPRGGVQTPSHPPFNGGRSGRPDVLRRQDRCLPLPMQILEAAKPRAAPRGTHDAEDRPAVRAAGSPRPSRRDGLAPRSPLAEPRRNSTSDAKTSDAVCAAFAPGVRSGRWSPARSEIVLGRRYRCCGCGARGGLCAECTGSRCSRYAIPRSGGGTWRSARTE